MSDDNTIGYAIYDTSSSLLIAGSDGGYFYDSRKAAQLEKDNMSYNPKHLEVVRVARIDD